MRVVDVVPPLLPRLKCIIIIDIYYIVWRCIIIYLYRYIHGNVICFTTSARRTTCTTLRRSRSQWKWWVTFSRYCHRCLCKAVDRCIGSLPKTAVAGYIFPTPFSSFRSSVLHTHTTIIIIIYNTVY